MSSPDDRIPDNWIELDCRGLRCPAPVIALARRLTELPDGTLVGVAATDAAARVDIPAFCRMRGQEYVGEQIADDGTAVFVVRRVE